MSQDTTKKYCSICRRSSEDVGPLISIPMGFDICSSCMQNAMDAVNNMQNPDMFRAFSDVQMGNMSDYMKMNADNQTKDESADIDISEVLDADSDNPDEETDTKEDKTEKASSGMYGMPNIQFLNWSDLSNLMRPMQGVKPKKKKKKEEIPILSLEDIPKPHIIKSMLDEYVVGQEHAKKVVSVGVYNHYKRVFSEKESDEIEIEKSNMLMIGPTGCGKTYLVKTLARLLNVPLAITDATSLTEAGYIGDDIESVVSKLLAEADNDVERAEQGIIFIDEIDKIAKKKNSHARDVSGESVQQGLLKLLEGSEIEVPVGATSKNAMVPLTTVNTRNILFICGGAFPDLEEIIKKRLSKKSSIGYGATLKDAFDKEKNILAKVNADDLREYGMIPEFIGRLPVTYAMEGLSDEMMVKILKEPKNAILKQYERLLEMDEVCLKFTDDALMAIVKRAQEKETGARALRAIIEEFMLDIMYEIPKDDNIGSVTISADYINGSGGPIIEMRG